MKLLLKNHITILFISYLILLMVLNILPINGKDSSLNNNYTLHIRWDYLGHFMAYSILGVLGIIYSKTKNFNTVSMLLFLFSFAVVTEILQKFIPYRTFNINDLVSNFIGIVLGFAFHLSYKLLKKRYAF